MAEILLLLCLAFVAIAVLIELVTALLEFSFGVAAFLAAGLCLIVAVGLRLLGY